jgi:hypothetical protein
VTALTVTSEERHLHKILNRLENQGLKEKGEAPISLTEARRRAKDKHIKEALAFRAKRIASKKARKSWRQWMSTKPNKKFRTTL